MLADKVFKNTFLKHLGVSLGDSFWLLFIIAVVIIFTGIGLRDPWPADEPRFALIAKEMVDTGQWFFPARAQELYPDKPPIFMWTIALFYWFTGSIRFSFLLPSAFSALLCIFLVYDISKRLWDKKTGIIAGWLLLFSLQFILQAKTAQIDAMVCAWITVASYGLMRYLLIDGLYRWYALAWFFMGIGVITKGVGFLPLLMLIPYALCRAKTRNSIPLANHSLLYWWCGPLIMLFAISLWFVPMIIIVANSDNTAFELYRDNILFKQTVTRYADSWHHIKPFWYYLSSVIPVFWLPATFLIPWLVKPWYKAIRELDLRIILPLGWVCLVVLFFSISPGKRGVYILPALPMLVVAIAPYYRIIMQKTFIKLLLAIFSLTLCFFVLLFGVSGLMEIAAVVKLANKFDIQPWYFFVFVGGTGLLAILVVWRNNQWLAWPIFMSILWLTYSTYGYYLRNPISTPMSIYQAAEKFVDDKSEIALVSFSEQFIFFATHPISHFGYHSPLEGQIGAAYQWQNADTRFVLIADKLIDEQCFDTSKAHDLGYAHRRHWLLLPQDSKRDHCKFTPSGLPTYTYLPK